MMITLHRRRLKPLVSQKFHFHRILNTTIAPFSTFFNLARVEQDERVTTIEQMDGTSRMET